MSNALALAGVTAVIRSLLQDGLVSGGFTSSVGSAVLVTALCPDRIAENADGLQPTQLNLFLYQAKHNAILRNKGQPPRDQKGNRRSNHPLALDLHYLVTAYGAEELHAEILLGYAIQLFHETPFLESAIVRRTLEPGPEAIAALPYAQRALAECGLADQVEQIRILPEPLTSVELSQLWLAIGAKYRPTATYLASVVLIEKDEPVGGVLPIL